MYPYQITQLTRDYSIGRIVPSSGLTDWQMAEACRQVGLAPLIYSRLSYGATFDHILYTYIESGIPVLTSTHNHVVACFGHYSDYSKPVAGMDTVRSSFFNEGFIINDDNCFPYQRMALQQVAAQADFSSISLKDIEAFTAPLPARVFLSADQFEVVVAELLASNEFGIEKCSPSLNAKREPIVTRTFLTTGRSFKQHLDARGMGNSLVFELYRNMPLPHFIWICELSTLNLYRSHEILGEVIWDATRNVAEPSGWLALHYPERLFVDIGSALNIRRDVRKFSLDNGDAYSLMKHNLVTI